MQKLGYCCGQNYQFESKLRYCFMKENCEIRKCAKYWNYKKYSICNKCFSAVKSDYVTLRDAWTATPRDNEQTKRIQKSKFCEMKNVGPIKEQFVQCSHCDRAFHTICVQYVEKIWKRKFLCGKCIDIKNEVKPSNRLINRTLRRTKLGTHLEKTVNAFLKKNDCRSKVTIRVVYQEKKTLVGKKWSGDTIIEEVFPYTAKTVCVFQEIEGCDVVIFAMRVYECGSECPQPNTRRVYLSYIDSLSYFEPKELKTSVYQEVMLAYMDYVRQLGFIAVHVWSCPPKKGDDYIFYCHPKEQKMPNSKRLENWYIRLSDKGKEYGIIDRQVNVYDEAIENQMKDVFDLPNFEGDVWILIKEEYYRDMLNRKHTAGNKKNLSNNFYVHAQKVKENYFVYLLKQTENASAEIVDPDPVIKSNLMANRESFLLLARMNNWEFSTLRKTKYSTLCFLYALYREVFCYTCNICNKTLEEDAYHCSTCQDFDLCGDCYALNEHEHRLSTKILESIPQSEDEKNKAIAKIVKSLSHVSYCISNCQVDYCPWMKIRLSHTSECKDYDCECQIWHYLVALHAKKCKNPKCKVKMCDLYKSAFQQQQEQNFARHLPPEAIFNPTLSSQEAGIDLLSQQSSFSGISCNCDVPSISQCLNYDSSIGVYIGSEVEISEQKLLNASSETQEYINTPHCETLQSNSNLVNFIPNTIEMNSSRTTDLKEHHNIQRQSTLLTNLIEPETESKTAVHDNQNFDSEFKSDVETMDPVQSNSLEVQCLSDVNNKISLTTLLEPKDNVQVQPLKNGLHSAPISVNGNTVNSFTVKNTSGCVKGETGMQKFRNIPVKFVFVRKSAINSSQQTTGQDVIIQTNDHPKLLLTKEKNVISHNINFKNKQSGLAVHKVSKNNARNLQAEPVIKLQTTPNNNFLNCNKRDFSLVEDKSSIKSELPNKKQKGYVKYVQKQMFYKQ